VSGVEEVSVRLVTGVWWTGFGCFCLAGLKVITGLRLVGRRDGVRYRLQPWGYFSVSGFSSPFPVAVLASK